MDALEALLVEIENVQKTRIKPALTWEALAQKIKDAQNPKRFEPDIVLIAPLPPPLPPEFPKLKVKYDCAKTGEAVEWIIVNNFTEETDYHATGWYTEPRAVAVVSASKGEKLAQPSF